LTTRRTNWKDKKELKIVYIIAIESNQSL